MINKFNNVKIIIGDSMILTHSTKNIRELNWSSTNTLLDETADYYLNKFENKMTEPLLHELDRSLSHVLRGIKIEDYIRMNWCPIELAAKVDRLLYLKNKFYSKERETSIVIKNVSDSEVSVENVSKKDNLSYSDIVNQFSASELKKLGMVDDTTKEDLETIPSELSSLLGDDEIKLKKSN